MPSGECHCDLQCGPGKVVAGIHPLTQHQKTSFGGNHLGDVMEEPQILGIHLSQGEPGGLYGKELAAVLGGIAVPQQHAAGTGIESCRAGEVPALHLPAVCREEYQFFRGAVGIICSFLFSGYGIDSRFGPAGAVQSAVPGIGRLLQE